jgi:hypothetical protein
MVSPQFAHFVKGPESLAGHEQFSQNYGYWSMFFYDSFALVKDDMVVSIFDTEQEAVQEGYSLYSSSGFMVQKLNIYFVRPQCNQYSIVPLPYNPTH